MKEFFNELDKTRDMNPILKNVLKWIGVIILVCIIAIVIPLTWPDIREDKIKIQYMKGDLSTHWNLRRGGSSVHAVTIDKKEGNTYYASGRTLFGIPIVKAKIQSGIIENY